MIPTTSTISQKSIYEEFWKKDIQWFSRDVETYRETGNNTNQQTDTFYCDLGL